jgi:hypothetical protein
VARRVYPDGSHIADAIHPKGLRDLSLRRALERRVSIGALQAITGLNRHASMDICFAQPASMLTLTPRAEKNDYEAGPVGSQPSQYPKSGHHFVDPSPDNIDRRAPMTLTLPPTRRGGGRTVTPPPHQTSPCLHSVPAAIEDDARHSRSLAHREKRYSIDYRLDRPRYRFNARRQRVFVHPAPTTGFRWIRPWRPIDPCITTTRAAEAGNVGPKDRRQARDRNASNVSYQLEVLGQLAACCPAGGSLGHAMISRDRTSLPGPSLLRSQF